ncbi:hypothetical protein MKX01_037287 [Papaver californicum]|nr:hypothetical protein MKX01_037287 [Papaver californicum]
MHLEMFEQMVHKKLCLEDIDIVSLLWMSENGVSWILKNHGCIELFVKVESPELANDNERSVMNTIKKKTMSKSPQVRRSPRLTEKNKSATSSTANKLFGHDENLRGGSSFKPVVVDDEPVEVDDEPVVNVKPVVVDEEGFDQEYCLRKCKESNNCVVQLQNIELDECHPVEDPETATAYNSDEDNEDDIEFEYGKTFNTEKNDNDDSSHDGTKVND